MLQRRELGAFATPARTADLMVRLLCPRRGDRVLDPAAGEGALVAALVRAGVPPERITAWDVDPAVCERLREAFPRVQVEQRDTLLETDLDGEGRPRWERIIANPPYLNKASGYVRSNRTALRRRFGERVGAGETYAMFLDAGLRLLAPSGTLVYIVSDTVRTLTTHERLRRRILARHLASLVATPPGLFAGTAVRAVILEIADRAPGPTRVLPHPPTEGRPVSVASEEIPAGTYGRVDGAPFAFVLPASVVALFDQSRRLDDLVDGHIGMHTRDNRRAIAALAGTGLAATYERRRRRRGEHRVIAPAEAASDRWRPYLKLGGDRSFHHPVVEYLDWSLRASYVIPRGGLFGRPGIAVSGVSRRLSARVMPPGCYWDSNKVIGLVPRDGGDPHLVLGLLNSDLYTFLAKLVLNDSTSVQISDLRRLPVPALPDAAAAAIAALAARCVARRRADPGAPLGEIGRRLDDAVYEAVGIDAADRATIAAALSAAGRERRDG